MKYRIPRGAYVGVLIALVAGLAACGKAPSSPPPPAANGPQFAINSPADGSFTAGTFVFSVQPLDPGQVDGVRFSAGGTSLPASDNLHVFVVAADYPEGVLELTATVTGKDGRSRSRTVTVQNIPVPESSATVGHDGAALGTVETSGSLSTLVVPPGGVVGGNLSFEARSQDEVLARTGVDYDSLGITFLGAQAIGTDRELDRTLMVTSGGFGPAVQPGQVVVNYLIMPDADGDGVGEIIVANTASVTPRGDVISDPVATVQLGETATAIRQGSSSLRALDGGLGGPPGTLLEIPVAGFNPASAWNNVAVFEGSGERVEQTGVVHTSISGAQTFVTVIPPLRPGNATVTLHSIGSGLASDPFRVNIEAMPPAGADPLAVIDSALADVLAMLTDFDAAVPGTDSTELRRSISALLDYWITELQADSAAEADAALAGMASMIQVSDLRGTVSDVRSRLAGGLRISQAGCNDILQKADKAIEVVNWVGRVPYTQLSRTNPVDLLGAEMQGGMVGEGWKWMKNTALEIDRALGGNACDNGAPPLPGPTGPSASNPNGTGAISGMGAAFSMGGSLVGSVNGAGFDPFNPASGSQNRGRYSIQLASSTTIPFSGSTDAGGYFMIPMTPAGETIEVHVVDTETGEVETVVVEAPLSGESSFLHIDFSDETVTETVTWTGLGGDGMWTNPENWSSNRIPQATDSVVISVDADVVLQQGSPATVIRSLTMRSGSLTLDGTADLMLLLESSIGVGASLELVSGNADLNLISDLAIDGEMIWSGGTITGGTLVNRNQLEVFHGHGTRQLLGQLHNQATMILSGSTSDGLRVGNGGTIRNDAGAVIEIEGDIGIVFGGDPRGVLTNAGIVRKSGGTGLSVIAAVYNSEAGHLEATSGTLLLPSGGILNAGSTYHIGTGAVLNVGASGVTFAVAGLQTGTGPGAFGLTGGNLAVDPAGATLSFPEGGVRLAGTRIEGTGSLHNASVLEVVSDSVVSGAVLVNEGRIVLHGPSSRTLGMGQAGTVMNLPDSVIEVAGDAAIYFAGGTQGTLVNRGTVHKTSGAETARLNVDFRNEGGTVRVAEGTLTLENGSGTGGEFEAAGGTTLILGWASSREFHLSGTYSGDGQGSVRMSGVLVADPAGVTLDFPEGGFQLQGTLEGAGATVTNNSKVEIVTGIGSGVYLYEVRLVNNGEFVLRGDSANAFRAGRGAVIENSSGALFDIQGDLNIISGGGDSASIRNAGTIRKSAGMGTSSLALCHVPLTGGVLEPLTGPIVFTPTCP